MPGHTVSDIVRDGNNAAGYTFCTVAVPHPGGQTETYYSDVFSVPRGNLRAASDAFLQFLAGKYSLQLHPPDSTCEDLLSARQADAQSRLDRTEGTNSGTGLFKVVKTGWMYSGAGSAGVPLTAAAQPSSSASAGQGVPRTKLFYCSAYFGPNGGENLAFSDTFEGPINTDKNRVRDDYVKFVKEKYSTKDVSGGCSADDKAKEAHNMRSKKIIETGWKPKTLPVVVQGP